VEGLSVWCHGLMKSAAVTCDNNSSR
jgi:hypothetical protein